MKQKLALKTISKLLTFAAFSFAISNSAYGKTFCTGLSKRYQEKISRKFNQNPFLLVESFLNIPESADFQNDSHSQNNLITASFDINRLYKANHRNLKSKAVSKVLFDWVRTQYFTNYDKSISSKNSYLYSKNQDLLNTKELNQMSNSISVATGIQQQACTKEEARFLACKSLFVVTAQSAPAVSCKQKNLRSAFETKFYLTFSKRYGFKILDISIAGKRIVLDSIKHMMSLKKKGFNKNALASHLSTLASEPNTFKFKKQIHTQKFLATLKTADPDRLPSSL
ncbi:MAG: hypothetical protein ACRBBP_04240 [Bdellovibrionales bacterium]